MDVRMYVRTCNSVSAESDVRKVVSSLPDTFDFFFSISATAENSASVRPCFDVVVQYELNTFESSSWSYLRKWLIWCTMKEGMSSKSKSS